MNILHRFAAKANVVECLRLKTHTDRPNIYTQTHYKYVVFVVNISRNATFVHVPSHFKKSSFHYRCGNTVLRNQLLAPTLVSVLPVASLATCTSGTIA